jgi:hypothetical protein
VLWPVPDSAGKPALLRFEHCCPIPVFRGRVNEEPLAALDAAQSSNVTGKLSFEGSGKLKGLVEFPVKVVLKDNVEVLTISYLQPIQCIHVSTS